MPLVRLLPVEEAPERVQTALLDAAAHYGGRVLNNWRAMAHSDAVFPAYFPFLRVVAGPGQLEQRIKELVALYAVILNRCRYSVSHRLSSSARAGVTETEVTALAAGDLTGFDEREQTALRLTRQLTLEIPGSASGRSPLLNAEQAETLNALFSDAQLVELLLGISLWNGLARFHRALDLPLDMPEPPPAIDTIL